VTLKAFRLYPSAAPGDPMSGEGARLYGGRWNKPGTPVVYTSESLALAVLEVLVNNPDRDALQQYLFIELEFNEKLVHSLISPLPDGWDSVPASSVSQDVGTKWADDRISAVLAVPSAPVPRETNYVINPLHKDFTKIKVSAPTPFKFDRRLNR